MDEKPYSFSLSRTEFRYEFESVSQEKVVQKVVLFTQTDSPQIFNLALLDVLEGGKMSDVSVTNNDDLRTVIATVFKIIEDFLNKNQDRFVIFKGSDDRRQRLYRIVIGRELELLQQNFQIWGVVDNEITIFEINKEINFYLIGKKMKASKKIVTKTTAEQIVQKKLNEVNDMLKKTDLSKLGIIR
jgi:hypothetical protein